MRRLILILAIVSGCGAVRTVPFEEEEEDDGCTSSECDTGTGTTSTTGGSSTGTDDADTETGEPTTDGGDTQFIPITDAGQVDMCDIWDPFACPEGEKCTAYATIGSSVGCSQVCADHGRRRGGRTLYRVRAESGGERPRHLRQGPRLLRRRG